MAKKETTTRTSVEELNENLSSIAQKVENNQKYILWAVCGIVVLAALIFGYIYGIQNPRQQAAIDEIAQADMALEAGQDSVALAQYMKVADAYSNAPANRANFQAAVLLYNNGKYEEAIKYMKEFDADGVLTGPAAKSLLGDCYVNLDKLDDALKAFDDAVSLADGNELYAPLFMLKKANVYRAQKKFAEEVKIYEEIKAKYPSFGDAYNFDVEKYLERANAEAGK